ncbi:MAG TPA: AMP-binding protein [Burkholderiales bacterium]|nr:AMP-binding protein [Burkholderiales bacterium]
MRRTALTYLALARAVDTAAGTLAGLGVRDGDRVLIVNENSAAAPVLALATTRIAAWPVLVNARLSAREIDAIAGHCTTRRTLFPTAGCASWRPTVASCRGTITRAAGVGDGEDAQGEAARTRAALGTYTAKKSKAGPRGDRKKPES